MMLRRMGWALAVVVLAVSVASAADADKVLLKQKFTPGSYVMTTTMNGEQSVTVDGTAQPTQQMSQTFVVGMDVGAADKDGAKVMQMTFKQVKQAMTAGAQKMEYDSAGPADKQDPNLTRAMGPLTKAKISVKIGADNKVISVGGLNELWDSMAKDNPEMAPFANQMKAQMGDNAIKDMVTKQAEMFPDKPVGTGDEWKPTMKFNLPMTGEVDVQQTCKLLGVESGAAGKIASIQYDGAAKSTKETTNNMGNVTVTVKGMTFKQTGTLKFNIDTGMVDSQSMSHEGTVEMAAPGPEGKPAQIVTKQKMKMEINVTKGAPAAAAK